MIRYSNNFLCAIEAVQDFSDGEAGKTRGSQASLTPHFGFFRSDEGGGVGTSSSRLGSA